MNEPEHKPWEPYRPRRFARLRGLRVRVRDWLWLRRVVAAQAADPNESIADYIVRSQGEKEDVRARLDEVWEAHEWQCDCTSDDPCRILIALRDGAA
jgi:hypothetical protein